jgi:hypothetical protein
MSQRSWANVHASVKESRPRSADFFCLIEPAEASGSEDPEGEREPTDAAVVTLYWGSTVVAMRTLTRSQEVSLHGLGVTDERPGPLFRISRGDHGITIYTPHGDALPEGTRMRMLVPEVSPAPTVLASRRATNLVIVCEAVRTRKSSRERAAALVPDARALSVAALSLAFFPLLLSILRVGAPSPDAHDDVEAQLDRLAFVQTALAAADKREEKAPPQHDETEDPGVSPARGGSGGSGRGEEGSQGDPGTRREEGLARAEQRRSAPPSAKETAEDANTFGMISLLDKDDKNARPASAFANFDIDAANGGLRGDAFADSFGMGSLGLSGVGEGGGGLGGGIGITQIGTLGRGVTSTSDDGSMGGQGFGRGHGHLSRAPRVTYVTFSGDGAFFIRGRLPPESIQRVVRSNFGRLRGCYEEGLLRNPQLEGRVNVKFVIARTGEVAAAELGPDSTLDDPKVTSCIVAHYKRMSFPEPEGGVVTVVYPVVFST